MTRTAAQFNTWICANAVRLKERLSLCGTFDEDAFQNAYLSLVSDYGKEESCPVFEKAFIAAYRKHSGKILNESYTICHPDDLFFTLLPSEDADPMESAPEEPSTDKMAAKIQRHIRAIFPQRDVRILELRLLGFSYRDITDTLGTGATTINNTINRIITQTRREFAAVSI